MSGNRVGGLKSAAKIKAKDPDFYAKIGSKGGQNGTTGGFAAKVPCDCTLIPTKHYKRNCAGVLGGMKSKRRNK